MKKYKNYAHFLVAKLYKDAVRRKITRLISWQPLPPLESGCTAIIGMCSRLPYVLGANLACLERCQWDDLKEVIITVDAEKSALPQGFEEDILARFPKLKITFLYYTPFQAEMTVKLKDPFVYSWLSWSTCLNHVRTATVLIQDYDALVLSKAALEKRYQLFLESAAKIQGITWYKYEGFIEADRLATTFEAFADVRWLRSFPPVMGYNRVGTHQGRQVNYDTYLDIQANYTPEAQRTIVPMDTEELVHPSQMITQYMRFRHSPGKKLPCSAVIMIPFFYFLSGQKQALQQATRALQQSHLERVDLLGDGVLINLSLLDTRSVDFILKLMLRALVKLDIAPFKAVVDYGNALYEVTRTPRERVWVGDFTEEQRQWVEAV